MLPNCPLQSRYQFTPLPRKIRKHLLPHLHVTQCSQTFGIFFLVGKIMCLIVVLINIYVVMSELYHILIDDQLCISFSVNSQCCLIYYYLISFPFPVTRLSLSSLVLINKHTLYQKSSGWATFLSVTLRRWLLNFRSGECYLLLPVIILFLYKAHNFPFRDLQFNIALSALIMKEKLAFNIWQ